MYKLKISSSSVVSWWNCRLIGARRLVLSDRILILKLIYLGLQSGLIFYCFRLKKIISSLSRLALVFPLSFGGSNFYSKFFLRSPGVFRVKYIFVKICYCLPFLFSKNRFSNQLDARVFKILYSALQYTAWFVKYFSITLLLA